jgi:squalene-hopene/tetraprenyl-beta-curcumene cyclase
MTTLTPPKFDIDQPDTQRGDRPRAAPKPGALARRDHLGLAVEALLGVQKRDAPGGGAYWCAELEGDSILITEYLLMKAILGHDTPAEMREGERALWDRMLVHLRRLQREDGTWGQYPGSPPDLSAMVKAYFTLKLFGDPRRDGVDAPHMAAARARIHEMGGAEKINTFSMFYLACLGQVSWEACPAIPPEIALLPRWSPFHLTKVAAWTRTMILPLALCSALRPVRRLDSSRGIGELFLDQTARTRLNKDRTGGGPLDWTNLFLTVDGAMKWMQRFGLFPTRAAAIRAAEKWLLERMTPETTHGLGAIFPPMVYIQIAFQAMGYERSHPVIVNAERELDRFIVDLPGEDHARIQPCFSPVWDTGIALYALTEAGLTCDNDERIAGTCEWLLGREVTLVGDWAANLKPEDRASITGMGPGHAHGGWAFEYRNDWYPDVDDTAMVCKALWRASGAMSLHPNPERNLGDRSSAAAAANEPEAQARASAQRPWTPAQTEHPEDRGMALARASGSCGSGSFVARRARAAATRGINWVLAMQNDDGGWAAFDRTRHREWMEHVPFADHNAMQDPSCADITGRTLEGLVTCGVRRDHPKIRAAVAYLRTQQRKEGCWWGRWGVNFLYGTWQAVGGLAAVGESPDSPYLKKTLAWLRSVQNADGGFGESANSYLDESQMGRGPSTPSQTAWGVCAMMELVGVDDPDVRRAIAWLEANQLTEDAPPTLPPEFPTHTTGDPAGLWREAWFTGTGFPKVFYLRYHHYRHYFPVMALARFARLSGG